MSRIVSISASASPKRHRASRAGQAREAVPLALPAPAHRASGRGARGGTTAQAQGSAYLAQLMAGAPRRGLRAAAMEQARIFAQYQRTQSPRPPLGVVLRALA